MKYRPNYPGVFDRHRRRPRLHAAAYVPWYNEHHRHTGIALFSPAEVHDGSLACSSGQRREHTQQAYYDAHPERFRTPPSPPTAPARSSASTYPDESPDPTDSTQLDNAREARMARRNRLEAE